MKLAWHSGHKSIGGLSAVDLPDFCVLVGRNGVGKSHLLEAINAKCVVVSDIGDYTTGFYDMASFRPDNTSSARRLGADQPAQRLADAYLLPRGSEVSPVREAERIFDECMSEIEDSSGVEARSEFVQSLRRNGPSLWDTSNNLSDEVCTYASKVRQSVFDPATNIRTSGNRAPNQEQRDANLRSILTAMRLGNKLPHELDRYDIVLPFILRGETLGNALSDIFITYKAEEYVWIHEQIDSLGGGKIVDLMANRRASHKPPWEVLRSAVAEMRDATGNTGLFDFDFTNPERMALNVANINSVEFTAHLINRSMGARHPLDSLSSGEKVLMALCLVSFGRQMGARPPGVLLLDEIDAVLHPSMVTALIRMLKTLYVDHGTKVIMTSHSPMTVAMLEEGEVFRVSREGTHISIAQASKAEAVEELSEGLATIDTGLRIAAYNEAKVIILTEGHNTKHLKRWAQLFFPEDVSVFEGLEGHSGKDQLASYGRMLARMSTDAHFVILWDCDAENKAKSLREELTEGAGVTPFAFERREENQIAKTGIENTYDEGLLQPYVGTYTSSSGAVSYSFEGNRKSDFAEYILNNGQKGHFAHYENLRQIVNQILGHPE